MTVRFSALLVCASLAAGCAATPKPRVFAQIEATERSPALVAARSTAPQAWARAESLRRRAERAHDSEDPAGAQILGEQALVAYQRAVTLAGLARAEARVANTEIALNHLERELARTNEIQAKLEADTRALELRVKVAQETLPAPVSGPPSSPERELARRQAARALTAQARLLCSAARLLEPKRASLEAAFQNLAALEAKLPKAPMAPIDEARGARSSCLRELSSTRRAKTHENPASHVADQLLSALSDASLQPSRDDRGIVVTVQQAFTGNDTLTDEARKRLEDLALVAKQHPAFPLLLVVHGAGRLPDAREAARAESAAALLRERGAPSVQAETVGSALPRLDPKKPGAGARNERLEVVFVAPSAS